MLCYLHMTNKTILAGIHCGDVVATRNRTRVNTKFQEGEQTFRKYIFYVWSDLGLELRSSADPFFCLFVAFAT